MLNFELHCLIYHLIERANLLFICHDTRVPGHHLSNSILDHHHYGVTDTSHRPLIYISLHNARF